MLGTLLPLEGRCSNTRDLTWTEFLLYLGSREPLGLSGGAENHRGRTCRVFKRLPWLAWQVVTRSWCIYFWDTWLGSCITSFALK